MVQKNACLQGRVLGCCHCASLLVGGSSALGAVDGDLLEVGEPRGRQPVALHRLVVLPVLRAAVDKCEIGGKFKLHAVWFIEDFVKFLTSIFFVVHIDRYMDKWAHYNTHTTVSNILSHINHNECRFFSNSLGVHFVVPVGEDGLVVVPELVDDGAVRLLVLVHEVRLGLGRHPSLGLRNKMFL